MSVDCTHTKIVIPSEYENLPVKRVDREAFKGRAGITSLTIPDSVNYIGYHAFQYLVWLQELTIPFVGDDPTGTSRYPLAWMFGGDKRDFCTYVEQTFWWNYSRNTTGTISGYIPNTLKKVTVTGGKIYRGSFQNCPNIEEIYLQNCKGIEEYAFDNLPKLRVIDISSTDSDLGSFTCYADKAEIFKNLKALEELKIGRNVYLPYTSFSMCQINSVYYTDLSCFFWLNNSPTRSIMQFAEHLYIGDTELAGEVVIPEGITYIPAYAFSKSDNISAIVLNDGIINIGIGAFSGLDESLFTESKNAYYIGTASNPYMVLDKCRAANNLRKNIDYKVYYGSRIRHRFMAKHCVIRDDADFQPDIFLVKISEQYLLP
jgi:hypothetical protein